MRSFDFSLRQLQYAVAVADVQGFRRAAQVCGVSQPSLSAQIARLEQSLGITLFERHARKTLLTPEGRDVVASMRAVLRATLGLQQQAAALHDPYSVPLRVGVIPTAAPYLLPRVDPRDDGVGLKVHWLELQTRACNQRLVEGDLDAIIVADPPSSDACEDQELGWEPFFVVGPPGSLCPGPVQLDQLTASQLMLLDEGHCLREHTLSLCHLSASGTSPYRGTSLPTVVQMVAAGLGSTVLPAIALPRESRGWTLEIRPFDQPIGRTLRLIWRSRSHRNQMLQLLAGRLTDAFAASMAEARALVA